MKKRSIRILWGVMIAVLTAIALLFLDAVGADTILDHYMTRKDQPNLSFSFDLCEDTRKNYKNTVLSSRWESETLVVTGVAIPNCSATWLFGSYEVVGNRMSLKYSPVGFGATACDCPREVRYEISGLTHADYDISISEGPWIEYTPFIYKLFRE